MNTTALTDRLKQARQDDSHIAYESFGNEEQTDLDASQMEFKRVVFHSCQFIHCSFHKSSFYECRMQNCMFVDCQFNDSYWRNTQVLDCKAEGCDFPNSHLKTVTIEASNFRYSNFSSSVLERCCLKNSNFREAWLTDMRINKPLFQQVDFSGADFFKTTLKDIDLSTCILDGIAVSENCAELRGAQIHALQAVEIARILGLKIV